MKQYLIMMYKRRAHADAYLKRMLACGYIKSNENAKVEAFNGHWGIFGYR